MGEDKLLTVGEVAALFRVSDKTVRRWFGAGRIRVYRLPGGQIRFRRSEIIVFWENRDESPPDASLG